LALLRIGRVVSGWYFAAPIGVLHDPADVAGSAQRWPVLLRCRSRMEAESRTLTLEEEHV
jgi:hypothetical protein